MKKTVFIVTERRWPAGGGQADMVIRQAVAAWLAARLNSSHKETRRRKPGAGL